LRFLGVRCRELLDARQKRARVLALAFDDLLRGSEERPLVLNVDKGAERELDAPQRVSVRAILVMVKADACPEGVASAPMRVALTS